MTLHSGLVSQNSWPNMYQFRVWCENNLFAMRITYNIYCTCNVFHNNELHQVISFSCLNFSKSSIVAFYEFQTCACCKLLLQTTRTLCASMLLLLQKITCSSGKYLDSFINEIQRIWDSRYIFRWPIGIMKNKSLNLGSLTVECKQYLITLDVTKPVELGEFFIWA